MVNFPIRNGRHASGSRSSKSNLESAAMPLVSAVPRLASLGESFCRQGRGLLLAVPFPEFKSHGAGAVPHSWRFPVRSAMPMALLLTLSITALPLRAATADSVPDQQAIDALAIKASQAQPREQCFLYAQLMQEMTELSARQYAAGNIAKASLLLHQIQTLSRKIHLSVTDNDKRLKNAEILLSRTAFRLTELLHSSDYEDQALIRQTIADVSQAQDAALMQVFNK